MRTIDADALVAQWEADAEQVEDVIAKMFIYGAIHDVKHAPTIETEPQWIPCSERLPKDGRYLCDYGDCIDFGRVTNGEWYVDGVIAWMPLPEPWKGDK